MIETAPTKSARADARPGLLIRVFVLIAAISLSCAATNPKAARTRILAVPESAPAVVFVTANDERERVIESLHQNGIAVTERIREAGFLLTASLGKRWINSDLPCGPVRNVRFQLRQNTQLLMVSKAKGRTGTCTPNVLDELSAEVARLIVVPEHTLPADDRPHR